MKKTTAQGVRILLVDDHPTMRAGLSMLLSHVGYEICGEVDNQAGLLQCLEATQPDVVLLDLSLDQENGMDLLHVLREQNVATLVYSMHENWATIEQTFKLGALGYVTKREGPAVLLEALEQIAAGKRHISPRASQSLASRILTDATSGQSPLSTREEQIMVMLGNGESNNDIAEKLHISVHTVQTYYTRIIEKLGLGGMKDLRKAAIKRRK